jgi:CheY-like chemotaxis protein
MLHILYGEKRAIMLLKERCAKKGMVMNELAEWLVHIEHLAENLYGGAARAFKDDEQLAGFLGHLAEEEARHSRVMGNIADYLRNNKGIASDISLDAVTMEKIEAPFLDCGSRLDTDSLQREHIINCVVAAEFSEWNDLFVYVLNALKEAGREFAVTASIMQTHKQHIEKFIGSLPEGRAYVTMMRRLPHVWEPRILVVEDYAGVRDLLSAVLSAIGTVETAENGKEALDKVRTRHFDVIVSDVNMPVMDGIQFFSAASRFDPRISKRFLFLAGNPTDETIAFIGKNSLRYLEKPMQINDLQGVVGELLDKSLTDAPGDRKREGYSKG